MTTEIKSTTEVRAPHGQRLTPEVVRDWIMAVPDGATLDGIVTDIGGQRDPERVLTGLKASWTGPLVPPKKLGHGATCRCATSTPRGTP